MRKLKSQIIFIIFFAASVIVMQSCQKDGKYHCSYEELEGKYLLYSNKDTSSDHVVIFNHLDSFKTNGIGGYGFWFPPTPMSGRLDGCDITLNAFKDVKRPGLPTPGGADRWFYESMSGHGTFYPEQDFIQLFIDLKRTGDFPFSYKGEIYLKRIE